MFRPVRLGVPEGAALFEQLNSHFRQDRMVLANPIDGSWESTGYGHDFKLPAVATR